MDKIYEQHKRAFDKHYAKTGTESWEQINRDYIFVPWLRSGIFKFITSNVRPFSNMKILDIGCGFGELLEFLSRKYAKFSPELYGCDISEIMLQAAQRRLGGVELALCPAENLPYGGNKFDYVICSEVLEHVLDPAKAIAEMIRVLKPQSLLIITTPHSKWEDAWHTRLLTKLAKHLLHRSPRVKDKPLSFRQLNRLVSDNQIQILFHQYINLLHPYARVLPKFTHRLQVKFYTVFEGKIADKKHCTQALVGIKKPQDV